ncbi:MAG TPA: MAPEG family protein [Nevskiaceae bacterium]|nr:MAPEG family protein [Nevskiaceae bacterium]
MTILPLYAALLTLLFLALSVRALRLRGRFQVAVGDGGQPALLRAIRAHGNFAEYVPLALILIGLVESGGGPGWLVHALGAALLIGRLAHAWGVSQVRETLQFRVVGMVLTFSVLTVASLLLLARVLGA